MASLINTLFKPFSVKGFYLLVWGTALGSNVWNTVSGYKSYTSLPRQTFGLLQSRLQPFYFSFQTLTTSTLLLTHLYFHPGLISSPLVEPHWATCEEGRQGLLIVASVVSSALNWMVIGPLASSAMFDRHRLERLESKDYDEPNPSEAMAKANRKFSRYHGITSALNMVSLLAIGGLGLAVSM